jgi:flagellar biosynthetic protein FlhB
MAGLRRLASLRSVVELVKASLKVALIAAAAVMAVRQEIDQLPAWIDLDAVGFLGATGWVATKVALWIAGTLAAIAAVDYGYQRFEWQRSLKMTKQEVKEEHRDTEGDPLLRSRVRSVQKEMARKRMMADVPKADVVVTNPTHLAVALRYAPESMAAPVVVAKGAGYVAERIKQIAREHGVMVVEQKLLARSLYKLVEIGREVPADLYRAVAEILALVYRSKGMTPDGHRLHTVERGRA